MEYLLPIQLDEKQIDCLESGHWIDMIIAVVFFNKRDEREYSTNLIDALFLVATLENDPREILFKLVRKGYDHESLVWAVEFREVKGRQSHSYAQADTIPLAICRAALKAALL